MNNLKLTPWFNSTNKPVRVGVYQRQHKYHGHVMYSKWDGKQWLFSSFTAEFAEKQKTPSGMQGHHLWRGVLK
jgi:hypothetical protein